MDDAADATLFIGRAEELARLDAAAALARGGRGGTIVVGGEAGIGKSWLLERFAASSVERGDRVLVGACLEFGGRGVPFAPFVEAFRTLARSVEPARLPALLGTSRHELARFVPELALHSGEVVDRPEFDRNLQARLFEAVLASLERLRLASPVVVIVEDIQWADDDTRDLIGFLHRHLRSSRVLIALSVRTDELDRQDAVARFLGELERDEGVERLELQAFDRTELETMLERQAGRTVPAVLVEEVLARTGGNPFYADQLLPMVLAGAAGLPPQLRDVLRARLAELPDGCRTVVRVAAAAGARFDDDLLADVLRAPIVEVDDALRAAIEAGVLVDDPASPVRPGYAFRHALVQEVAYGQLLAGERVRLHAAFGRALVGRRSAGDRHVAAAELAYHLDLARDDLHAIPALIDAGLEAEQACAFGLARQRYERALELWDRGGPEPDVAALDRAGVLQRAAEASLLSGAYGRAIELARTAVSLLETSTPVDRARLGLLHDRLRWYLWEAGDDSAAEAAVVEALRLIPADPPSAPRARALGQAAGLRMYAGDLGAAADLAGRAVVAATAAAAPAEEAFALGIIGWCQALVGDVDHGIATFHQGLDIAVRLGGPEGIALGHANLAALLDRVGRTDASLAAALEGFAVVRRLGVARTYGGILSGHATKALFDLGRWPEALAMADEGLGLDPVGSSAIWIHINYARLDTNRGRFGDAAEHLDAAQALRELTPRRDRYGIALLAARADLAGWQGSLEGVRAAVASGIAAISGNRPLDPALGWLASHGLRAEADEMAGALARHDAAAVATARAHVRRILRVVRGLSRRPASAADARREAILALCHAEARRLTGAPGTSTASAWVDVARLWDGLSRPYPAAYARFRAGEAVLRSRGGRETATQHLQAANETAVALGAKPMQRAIELLARHARIPLDHREPADQVRDGRLGLTDRETEVLRLVAAGWSNQQIADALFIARKTASVHVSNIVAKFGVSNRVEAAAIAHRLGMVSHPAGE